MKKIQFWSLLAGLVFGSLAFVACGDDKDDDQVPTPQPETPKDPDVPNSTGFTVDDLVGVWTIAGQDDSYTYTFTKETLTITTDGQESFSGNYTLKDDIISYKADTTVSAKLGLLYNKTVLVLKDLVQNNRQQYYEFSAFMFKQGATVPATTNDIQGNWHWYMYGDSTYVRTALKIDGNKFDIIITPWGQRFTGTFTYSNGYLHFNTEHGYTSREEDTGYGFGEGTLNPETLEATWYNLDEGYWNFWPEMPFIANGNEAYGIVANLSALFYKK